MCQWSKNLCTRLEDFPLDGAERLDDNIVARMVPKFHLAAHCQECQANFSLNYEPGAGRRDMEGPERTWFGLQGGGSTKDQGPGYWSDAMDDKFGHWNWTKLLRLGMSPYFLLREGEHSFLMLMKVRSLQRSTWTLLARKSSTQKNCCLSTQDCHQVSFSHGKRRSQLGRKIGAPQILTTYLK